MNGGEKPSKSTHDTPHGSSARDNVMDDPKNVMNSSRRDGCFAKQGYLGN